MNTYQTSIKDRYIINVLLKPPSWVNQTIRDHHMVPVQTSERVQVMLLTNTNLPIMHRRSITETIIHPICQNNLLIYPHFETANLQT